MVKKHVYEVRFVFGDPPIFTLKFHFMHFEIIKKIKPFILPYNCQDTTAKFVNTHEFDCAQ